MAVQSPKKSSALPWPAFIPLGHHAEKPPISLGKMVILVGSRHNAHLHLLSRHVSKAHALILSFGGRVYIRDLASREQVYVNGVPEREAWLKDGDLIKIGTFTFKFKEGPAPGAGVEDDAPPHAADLEISGGDSPLAVAEKVMLIGRRGTCDVALMEDSVSTAHAVIFHVGGKRYVRDLGSRTGTFVNGRKVHQHELEPDDTIQIGETEMRYTLSSRHDHAIAPADVGGTDDSIDELEDLVGTAPLDMAAEIQRDGQVLPAELELAGAGNADNDEKSGADELIELELSPEPAHVPAKPSLPRPQPKAATPPPPPPPPAPVEPLELEPVADDMLDSEFQEIDLSADPDISDLPNAADTRALGLEFQTEPPKPTLGEQVVDAPVGDVGTEKGAGAGELRTEATAEATWPPDLEIGDVGVEGTTVTSDSDEDEVDIRGGWQGMQRADDASATATPVAGESAAPAPEAAEAPELTPAVEAESQGLTPDDLHALAIGGTEVAQTPVVEEPVVEEPIAVAPAPVAPETPVIDAEAAPPAPAVEKVAAAEVAPEVEVAPKKGRGRKAKADKPAAGEKAKRGKGGRWTKRQLDAAVVEALPEQPTAEPLASDVPAEGSEAPAVAGEASSAAGEELPDMTPLPEAEKPAAAVESDAPIAGETSLVGEESPVVADEPVAEVAGEITAVEASSSVTSQGDAALAVEAETPVAADDITVTDHAAEPAVDENAPIVEAEGEAAVEAVGEEIGEATPLAGEVGTPSADAATAPPSDEPEFVGLDELEEDLGLSDAPGASNEGPDKAVFAAPVAHDLEEDAPAGGDSFPVLELDQGDLRPIGSDRDPDSLLAADDGGKPGDVEVIERTEPTPDSAFDLLDVQALGDESEGDGESSLTDSTFGRQVEAFTATSSGDIVEDLPELEEAIDPDEALAISLGEAAQPSGRDGGATSSDEEFEALLAPDDDEVSETQGSASAIDVTADAMEAPPAADAGGTLTAQQFDGAGDAVLLETPGLAEADAVLGGQSFVADAADGQDVARTPTQELDVQEFVAEPAVAEGGGGDEAVRVTDGAFEIPEPPPPEPVASHAAPAQPPVAPPAPPQPPVGPTSNHPARLPLPPQAGLGMAGGGMAGSGGLGGDQFVIGSDLSSFIGGMPLVLPDLPAPPSGFGKAQVSFAGAKAPWEQKQRPTFPIGQGLADEMTQAAEGLRDVEEMDDALAMEDETEQQQGPQYARAMGPGAPGDEWNVAAALADDDADSIDKFTGTSADDRGGKHFDITAELAAVQALQAEEFVEEYDDEVLDEDEQGVEDDQDIATGVAKPQPPVKAEAPRAKPAALPPVEKPLSEAPAPTPAPEPAPEREPAPPEAETDELTLEGFELLDDDLPIEPIPEDELLNLDEPTLPLPETPHAAGLVEEAEADLHLEPETEIPAPVVDRSPPPPPAPPAPSIARAAAAPLPPPVAAPVAKAAAPGKAAVPAVPPVVAKGAAPAAPKMVPPPPARGPRGRGKDVPAAPVASSSSSVAHADSIFGSMEHGADVGENGNGESGEPFAGMGSAIHEVDVFSQSAPGDEAGGFGGGNGDNGRGPGRRAAGGAGNGASALTGRRPQRVIVPPRMGELGGGGVATAVEAVDPFAEPSTRALARVTPARRKNPRRRMIIGFVLMLVLMGLVVAGVLIFMRAKQMTVGALRFLNTTALTKLQRDELHADQINKLTTPRLLIDARSYVESRQIPAGFLADPEQFARGVRPTWHDDQSGVMTIEYRGPEDANDKQRVMALMVALYLDNAAGGDRSKRLTAEITALDRRMKEFDEKRQQRDTLRKALESAPDAAGIKALEEQAHRADAAYDAAVAGVKDAQLAVQRAQERLLPGAAAQGESNAKDGGGGKDPQSGDAELAALEQAMTDASSKLATAKSAAGEEADGRRKQLDQAIEQFQQTAAGMMKDNPQLAQYVQAVQQLQEQTHKLGGDLIEVQQQQHNRLSAWKKDIDEQVQSRRSQIWAADRQLTDLRSQYDLAQRKYNAAIDLNYPADSKEVKDALADIRGIADQIEARKMAIGNDPFIAKLGDQLQELINVNKERLDADRARVEKDIKAQEQAFAQANVVEKLPDTQRAQAAALKGKQEAINDLRKQYAAALDKRTAESNAAMRELEGQVSSLAGKIDERKRALAAANDKKTLTDAERAQRQTDLARRQAELKKAEEQSATAQRDFVRASRALTAAMAQNTDRTTQQNELESLNTVLPGLEDQNKLDQLALEEKKDLLRKQVTVSPPEESSIQVSRISDDRWLYALVGVGGLALLFGAIAVFSVTGDHKAGGSGFRVGYGGGDEGDAEAGPLALAEIGAHGAEETNEETLTGGR